MTAPIVYRWDDGNAPVARGERRSLCDILYACLVTGYGDKLPAGWTREYVNATFDKAVFRNNPATGTGFYLQVDGAGAAYAYRSSLMAYEVMSSVDNGLFPFYASTARIDTSATANTTARPWVLIADDRAFYFFCWLSITAAPTSADLPANMFFGDLVPYNTVDPYACALSLSDYSTFTTYTSFGFMYSPAAGEVPYHVAFRMPRRYSGVSAPFLAAMIRGGGPGADTYAGSAGVPYTEGGPILYSRPHINDGAASSLRGWAPGYYYPCHPNAFGQLATMTVDESQFLSIRYNSYVSVMNAFISLADWRV